MAKNNTQKKDKFNYRPWRQFNACYSCGKPLKDKYSNQNFCDACRLRLDGGHDLW